MGNKNTANKFACNRLQEKITYNRLETIKQFHHYLFNHRVKLVNHFTMNKNAKKDKSYRDSFINVSEIKKRLVRA